MANDLEARLLLRYSSDFSDSVSPSLSDYFSDSDCLEKPRRNGTVGNKVRTRLSYLTYYPLGIRFYKTYPSRRRRIMISLFNMIALGLGLHLFCSLAKGIFCPSYSRPPRHYQDLETRIQGNQSPGRGNVNNETVFIAANIIKADLISGTWGDSLVSLIDLLGPENVFLSIYENDSGVRTEQALEELRTRVKCEYRHCFVAEDMMVVPEKPIEAVLSQLWY
jgi:hypothetical protein